VLFLDLLGPTSSQCGASDILEAGDEWDPGSKAPGGSGV